jgi:hypothetical protein
MLINMVKTPEFHEPRDYQTIGAGWTVDTWCREQVTIQLMDEGYTTVISAPGLKVTAGYNGKEYVRFDQGGEADIEALLIV